MTDEDILVVTTTVADREQARALANGLLEARLAACVQLDAIESLYRWEGKVQVDAEVRLTIKTTARRRDAVEAFLREHHPYDLPQVVAWTAEASAGYAAWVRDETTIS